MLVYPDPSKMSKQSFSSFSNETLNRGYILNMILVRFTPFSIKYEPAVSKWGNIFKVKFFKSNSTISSNLVIILNY